MNQFHNSDSYLRDKQGHFQAEYVATATLDIIESLHVPGIEFAQMADFMALTRTCHSA